MSTDPDIQFGDVEEEQPDVELRPDRNAHFAVVPYEEPAEGELPIFIDLDVLIEMESHALTDTSVELGGVMLGGQLHDEDGQPYILVQDSVRAQHYEATKGSFKFTHDTWQQITKERDDFPSDWDMVGWYHTHPDWGVFLSGMDMFICDNFFNKPLDVALVIDPCRQDRAFFQWTGDPRERKRRVSGFFVIASRHRQAELEQFVAELEGGYTMRTDPNLRQGYNVNSGGGGAPTVVNITEQRPGWMGQAVMGMLFVQTVMLLMFGYMAFGTPQDNATRSASDEQRLLEVRERDLRVRREALDDVIKSMSGQDDVAKKMEQNSLALDKAEQDLLIARAGVPVLVKKSEELEKDLVAAKESLEKARGDRDEYKADATKWKKEAEAYKKKEMGEGETAWYSQFMTMQWLAIGLVVVAFVGAASFFAFRGMAEQDEIPDNLLDDPPPDGHFSRITPPEDGAGEGEPTAEGEQNTPEDDGVGFEDEPPRRDA